MHLYILSQNDTSPRKTRIRESYIVNTVATDGLNVRNHSVGISDIVKLSWVIPVLK